MALSERINHPRPTITGLPCSVGTLLAELDGLELAALQAMLHDYRQWPASEIYRVVTEEGHLIGRQSIGRHRGRKCRCYPARGAEATSVVVVQNIAPPAEPTSETVARVKRQAEYLGRYNA
jgi:hypothetical protein